MGFEINGIQLAGTVTCKSMKNRAGVTEECRRIKRRASKRPLYQATVTEHEPQVFIISDRHAWPPRNHVPGGLELSPSRGLRRKWVYKLLVFYRTGSHFILCHTTSAVYFLH